MSKTWNADANEKVLLVLVKEYPGVIPYGKIATALGVTATAVKSHIARLKAKKVPAGTDDSEEPAEDPKPPKGRKRAAATTKSPKKAKKPKSEEKVVDSAGDDNDENAEDEDLENDE